MNKDNAISELKNVNFRIGGIHAQTGNIINSYMKDKNADFTSVLKAVDTYSDITVLIKDLRNKYDEMIKAISE